jgi:hypothetical protein
MFSTSQEEDIIFSMGNEDFRTLEDSTEISSQLDFLNDINIEQMLESFNADSFTSNDYQHQPTAETSADDEYPLENLFDFVQNDNIQDFHIVQLESPSVSNIDIRIDSPVSSFNDNDLSSTADNSNFDTSSCSSIPMDFSSFSVSSKIKKSTQQQKRLQRSILEKKEANKAATVRYRSKKVKERDELFAQVSEYSKKNLELKNRIENLQSEIGCIKNLIIQIYVKKNS